MCGVKNSSSISRTCSNSSNCQNWQPLSLRWHGPYILYLYIKVLSIVVSSADSVQVTTYSWPHLQEVWARNGISPSIYTIISDYIKTPEHKRIDEECVCCFYRYVEHIVFTLFGGKKKLTTSWCYQYIILPFYGKRNSPVQAPEPSTSLSSWSCMKGS